MKRLIFGCGLGIGFLIGSKAGSKPEDWLEAKARLLARRSGAKEAVDTVRAAAGERVSGVTESLGSLVPAGHSG